MDNMINVAIDAAKKAGEALLELSKSEIKYEMKNRHDILAEGDLVSEKTIIETIKCKFPDHDFLSEEKGEEITGSDYLWVIDPIDGTINFSRGIEEFCISIALVCKGEIQIAVIYQPMLGKLYAAQKGKGAFLNEKKISVSNEDKMINMLLATDNSSKIDDRVKNFDLLAEICTEFRHSRIFGSGALHLAKLAEGKIDCYFETRFHFWDYAAGVLLIKEAGGEATDFDGSPIDKDSRGVVASNGRLHKEILNVISGGLNGSEGRS